MAAMEMWDYLSTATAASTYVLNLAARGIARETGQRNQIVHLSDDEATEEIISFDTKPQFFIDVPWSAMNESDAGTVFDFWASTAKGDGMAKRFHYTHAYGTQSHNYVVRFADNKWQRQIMSGNIHRAQVTLKVKGRSTEA